MGFWKTNKHSIGQPHGKPRLEAYKHQKGGQRRYSAVRQRSGRNERGYTGRKKGPKAMQLMAEGLGRPVTESHCGREGRCGRGVPFGVVDMTCLGRRLFLWKHQRRANMEWLLGVHRTLLSLQVPRGAVGVWCMVCSLLVVAFHIVGFEILLVSGLSIKRGCGQ